MRDADNSFIAGKNLRTARLIFLYQIKYDELANKYLRWTNYGKPITFQGNEYVPYIIKHSSMSEILTGRAVNLTLTIANVNRYIQAIHDNNDLTSKEVTIYSVAEEDIQDAQAYTQDKFSVKTIVTTKSQMTLALSSVLDVNDIRLPKRFFYRAYCRFRFKGSECKYAGVESECNKSLQRCRELDNVLNFGAFPSIPVQRLLVE